MKVSTPAISWHNRERISSIDFQPVCYPAPTKENQRRNISRLASGGDDKHVVIWDITISDERSDESKNECGKVEPSCLCDLSRHQNSVNIVRWAPNGQILASGDTDSAIFLWHFQEDSLARPDLFGDGNDGQNNESIKWAESWSVLKILRGHLQDVVGLAWSSCGSQLASCSTDATTIVFDINKGTKLKILSDHKGWVNGVAWAKQDPFSDIASNGRGNLASLASDRCLRVYNAGTKNFKNIARTHRCKLRVPSSKKSAEELTISENSPGKDVSMTEDKFDMDVRNVRLFHDDTFPSFYRRLDFSPDGELLVVPSGVLDVEGETSDAPHCTLIFCTSNYSKPVVYLPGKEFSVAVRFSPMKYELRPVKRQAAKKQISPKTSLQDDNESIKDSETDELKPWEKYQTIFCLPYRMIYAVATQNSIMMYDTQQTEPFARISRIHYIGLNDLSWSSDGNTLVVSSTDGYCSIINFKKGELGAIYQPQEELVKEISLNKIEPKTEPNLPNEDGIAKTTNTNNYSEFDKIDSIHKGNDLISTEKKATEPQDSTEEPMEIEDQPTIKKDSADIVPKKMDYIEEQTKPSTNILLDKNDRKENQLSAQLITTRHKEEAIPEKTKKRAQLITLSSNTKKT